MTLLEDLKIINSCFHQLELTSLGHKHKELEYLSDLVGSKAFLILLLYQLLTKLG